MFNQTQVFSEIISRARVRESIKWNEPGDRGNFYELDERYAMIYYTQNEIRTTSHDYIGSKVFTYKLIRLTGLRNEIIIRIRIARNSISNDIPKVLTDKKLAHILGQILIF